MGNPHEYKDTDLFLNLNNKDIINFQTIRRHMTKMLIISLSLVIKLNLVTNRFQLNHHSMTLKHNRLINTSRNRVFQ